MWKAFSLTRDKGEVAKVEEGKTSEHSVCMSYLLYEDNLLLFNLKKGLVKLKYDSSWFFSCLYWQDFKNVSYASLLAQDNNV